MRSFNQRTQLTDEDIKSNRPPVERFNAKSEPCDVIQGPCLCGATHTVDEWNQILKDEKTWTPYPS